MKNFETTVVVEDVGDTSYTLHIDCEVDPEDGEVLKINSLEVESAVDWRMGDVGLAVEPDDPSDWRRLASWVWNCHRNGNPCVRGESDFDDENRMTARQRESMLQTVAEKYFEYAAG